MTIKHIGIALGLAVVTAAAIVAVAVWNASSADDKAALGPIRDSYAFDVTDKRQLMRHADDVFVGEVIGVDRTEAEASSTVWRVAVVANVKGQAAGEILVRQIGYVDEAGNTHATEEQPLLEPGRRYLLVTTRGDDANVLMAGPAASVRTAGPASEARLAAEYRAAMK